MSGYFYSASPAAMRRRDPRKTVSRGPVQPPYTGPPRPPSNRLIDQLFPDEPKVRTEAQWSELLDARVKPFIDQIDKSTAIQRGMAEFEYEQAARTNQGLSEAFLKILTGGRTGAEAEQFSKEQFGGQYLGAQAMTIAADRLSTLTSDWDEAKWKLSSEWMKAMAEIPGLKEQMRSDIQDEEANVYERQFKYATLLLDEAWNTYNAQAKAYSEAEQRRIADEAIRREQGITGYKNRKDAVAEAAKFASQTETIWSVKQTKQGWVPYDTKKKQPKPAGSTSNTNAIRTRNSVLTEARDLTRVTNTVWRIRKVNGVWQAYNTGKRKAVAPGKKPKGGLSDAQVAENKLTAEFYADKDKYLGTMVKNTEATNFPADDPRSALFIQQGGVSYDQAYRELSDYAYSVLSPYGRSANYIEQWVRRKLRVFYPNQTTSGRPRQGG